MQSPLKFICRLTLLALVAVAGSLANSQTGEALSGSEFQPGYIIADSVFFNANTMSTQEIQSFLNSKVPTCDTNGTQPSGRSGYPTRASWGTANGAPPPYTCLKDYSQSVPGIAADTYCNAVSAGTKSAAQIISDVASACSINPQALIVLLQKEQSLITDDWPWPEQYQKATGYACPDTAPCDSQYYGFFNQVYNAARQFQRYGKSPVKFDDYNYHPGRYNRIYFNPNPNCGYSDIYIENQATAGLYNYTPYQPNSAALNNLYTTGDACSAYGNRNFWRMFNDWFGSPVGDLVRTVSDATVYLISGAYKYPIASGAVLGDFASMGPLRFVPDAYINSLNTGMTVGNMARGPDGSLYLVNAGIKLGFTSCSGDVADYGYTCNPPFLELTGAQLNRLVAGPNVTKLIRSNTNGTIYYMSGGKKRPFTSWEDLTSLNIPISVNVFNNGLVNYYPTGSIVYGPGSLVKTPSSGTVYVAKEADKLMPITGFIYPQELGLNSNIGLRTMSDADLQQTYNNAQGASNLTNKVKCSTNNYVGTQGFAYLVSGLMATNYGFTDGDFVDVGTICAKLKFSSQPLSQYMRVSNGTIYYVTGGQKRAFTSYATYQSSAYCNNACTLTHVSDFFADSIASGANL